MANAPTHPDYDGQNRRWKLAWDVYTGEYSYPEKIANYLIRRKQGEHPKAYAERKDEALADPALDFATVVDSLVGMLFSNPEKTTRTWRELDGDGEEVQEKSLGDPEEDGTRAHRYRTNVNGRETGIRAQMKQVATRLTAKHTVWGLADGAVANEDDEVVRPPTGQIIEPEAVVNWREENGRLVEVLKRNKEDKRSSVFDDPEDNEATFIHYELDGWTEKNAEGEAQGPKTNYAYYDGEPKESNRILPIFRQTLELPREVGYLLARKTLSIFNMESELDAYGRMTNLPRFGVASNKTGKGFKEIVSDLASGQPILQIPPEGNSHEYIVPPAEHMQSRKERLRSKREDFFVQAFREYGDSAAEVTATEMEQSWAAGVLAFETHLNTATVKFEKNLFKRLEQAEFPDAPGSWGQYDVSRTVDLSPSDALDTLNNAVRRVFGTGRVPIPKANKAQLLQDWLDELGQDAEIESIEEAIDAFNEVPERSQAQQSSLL